MANGSKAWYDTTLGKIGIGVTTGGIGLLARDAYKKSKEYETGIKSQIQALGAQELAPETQRAFQESQAIKYQGMSDAAKALAQQQTDRSMLMGLRSLRSQGRGAALAGVGAIVGSGQDAALRLASADEEMRRRNREMAMRMGMDYGQKKLGLQQYKQQGLYNYYMGRKSALNQQISSALKLGARAAAAVATGGASELAAGVTMPQ